MLKITLENNNHGQGVEASQLPQLQNLPRGMIVNIKRHYVRSGRRWAAGGMITRGAQRIIPHKAGGCGAVGGGGLEVGREWSSQEHLN